MKRRDMLTSLPSLGTLTLAHPASAQPECTTHARRPLAARHSHCRRHYRFCAVADRLAPGNKLTLRRQIDNEHDGRAVEVFRKDEKPGDLLRLDNAAVASLLGRGHRLQAQVLHALESARFTGSRYPLGFGWTRRPDGAATPGATTGTRR